MAESTLTPQEAMFLVAIKGDAEFSLSQAMMLSNMSPTEARGVVSLLVSKGLIKNIDDVTLALTESGIKARRKLVRGDDVKFLISAEEVDESEITRALGEAIDRLK